MSFFPQSKFLKKCSISNGKVGRGCHMALPYGLAIWLCHMALPYGIAIWHCHIWHCYNQNLKKKNEIMLKRALEKLYSTFEDISMVSVSFSIDPDRSWSSKHRLFIQKY